MDSITSEVNAEIADILKCPCCFAYMDDRIFVCVQGHNVCINCHNPHDLCPLCKSMYTNIPNLSLERVAQLVYYPCHNEGCDKTFRMEQLREHSASCEHRDYDCPMDDCDWVGLKKDVSKHCLIVHDRDVVVGKEYSFFWNLTGEEHTVKLMLAFNETFYVHRKVLDGIMYLAVQYVGRIEDVILYYYQLQVSSDQFYTRRLDLCEICHEDIKSFDEIIDHGFCISIPLNLLKTYINCQDMVYYKIKILKS